MMSQKRCKTAKMLWALLIFAAVLSSPSAAAEPAALCDELRQIHETPSPLYLDGFQRYRLFESLPIGGKPGEERYYNIDVDGDDISDDVAGGCPGSTEMPADPCMLTIKLSSSGKLIQFEAWGFFLFRYHSKIFVFANADETNTKTNIYRVDKAGVKLVCAQL